MRNSPDSVFAPPGEPWQPVSAQLASVRRLVLLVVLALLALVAGSTLAVFVTAALAVVVGLLALAVGAWAWWLIGRNWRSWGYAERADDLLITHGVLFRHLVVVPYGRMQFVDVTAGPLERRFGIATVQLHTASPATDARIPGLSPTEAARLRDRLAALGEAQAAGL